MKNQHALDPDHELSVCCVCNGAEGSLPTLCPGRRLTGEEQEAIYAGTLDFDRGVMIGTAIWWVPK